MSQRSDLILYDSANPLLPFRVGNSSGVVTLIVDPAQELTVSGKATFGGSTTCVQRVDGLGALPGATPSGDLVIGAATYAPGAYETMWVVNQPNGSGYDYANADQPAYFTIALTGETTADHAVAVTVGAYDIDEPVTNETSVYLTNSDPGDMGLGTKTLLGTLSGANNTSSVSTFSLTPGQIETHLTGQSVLHVLVVMDKTIGSFADPWGIKIESVEVSVEPPTLEKLFDGLEGNAATNAANIAAEVIRAEGDESAVGASWAAEAASAGATAAANTALFATANGDEAVRAGIAEAAIQAGINVEEARAQAAELALSDAVTALAGVEAGHIGDLGVGLAAEAARATAAEGAVQGDEDANEAAAAAALASASATLQAQIDANGVLLATQNANAAAAEATLQAAVDNVRSNADPAALDSLTEVVNHLSSADTGLNDLVNRLILQVVDIQGALDTFVGVADSLPPVLLARYTDLQSNLMGKYEFEGQLGLDASPYAYLLVPDGDLAAGAGLTGSATLVLDGASQLHGQDSSHPLLGSTGMSVLFWLKPGAGQRTTSFFPVRKAETDSRGWRVRWRSAADGGEALEFEAMHAAGSRVLVSYTLLSVGDTLFDGDWHHVAFTWDGSTASSVTCYLDGGTVAGTDSGDELCALGSTDFHATPIGATQIGTDDAWTIAGGGLTIGVDYGSAFVEDLDLDHAVSVGDTAHAGYGGEVGEAVAASGSLVLSIDRSGQLHPLFGGAARSSTTQWRLDMCTVPGDPSTAVHTLLHGQATYDPEEVIYTLSVRDGAYWPQGGWGAAHEAAWVGAGHPAGTVPMGAPVAFTLSDFATLVLDPSGNTLRATCRYDDASSPLRVGSSLSGEIDSLRIYGAPLGSAAVAAHRAELVPTYPLSVSTVFGAYPSEVSWLIEDADGADIAELAAGHGLSGTSSTSVHQVEDGSYTATLADSYGDGWNGAVLNLESTNALAVGLTNFNTGAAGSFQFSMTGGTLAPIGSVPDAMEVPPGSHRCIVCMTTSVGEITYSLTAADGTPVVASTSTTVCRDTYAVAYGSYTLQINDSGGDGSPSSNYVYVNSVGGDFRSYYPMPSGATVSYPVTLTGLSVYDGHLRWIFYDSGMTGTQDWWLTDSLGATVASKSGESYYYPPSNSFHTLHLQDTTPGAVAWTTQLRVTSSYGGSSYYTHSGAEGATETQTLTLSNGVLSLS